MEPREEVDGRRTVVVVDDDDQVRTLIARVIGRSAVLAVVGEATDFASAYDLIEATRPEIAVLDRSMPGPDAATAFRRLRGAFPETALVVLSGTPVTELEPELLGSVDAAADKCGPLERVREALETLDLRAGERLTG